MNEDRVTFIRELEILINRHSLERGSNTPDYILAQYLKNCLTTYELAIKERDRWYGVNPSPMTRKIL